MSKTILTTKVVSVRSMQKSNNEYKLTTVSKKELERRRVPVYKYLI